MTQALAFAFGAALSASEAGCKTNQVHERGRGTLRAAKPTAECIHKKARTEDEADGRLQDKHLDKNPAIIQVYRESKSRGLPEGANF